MGLIKWCKPGVEYLESESDPRWNCNWRVDAVFVMGGRSKEAELKVEELTKKYGDPPKDLYFGCMKD